MEVPSDYFVDGKSATYRLDGIIVHQGGDSARGGHYWALVRKFDAATKESYFAIANDGTVGRMKLDPGETEKKKVLDYAGNAYILIFEKIT